MSEDNKHKEKKFRKKIKRVIQFQYFNIKYIIISYSPEGNFRKIENNISLEKNKKKKPLILYKAENIRKISEDKYNNSKYNSLNKINKTEIQSNNEEKRKIKLEKNNQKENITISIIPQSKNDKNKLKLDSIDKYKDSNEDINYYSINNKSSKYKKKNKRRKYSKYNPSKTSK